MTVTIREEAISLFFFLLRYNNPFDNLKTMDTTTVIAINKMIDTRIEGLNLKIKTASDFDSFLKHTAQVEILTSLSNHLDCFLDQQLDAYEVESQLPEC